MRGSVLQPPSAKAASAKAARAKPRVLARAACTPPRPADVASKPPGDMLITPHERRYVPGGSSPRIAISPQFTPPIRPPLPALNRGTKPRAGNHNRRDPRPICGGRLPCPPHPVGLQDRVDRLLRRRRYAVLASERD